MKFLILLSTLVFSLSGHAVNEVRQRDLKLPSQSLLEHQQLANPVLADNDRVKTTFAGPTSAAAVVLTSFTAQPDVARNITITPTGTTGDVESCAIVVAGTNVFGRAISETITFAADDAALVAGVKAFRTVSSVTWPANCESGGFAATWIVGVGDVLGLSRCMPYAGALAWTAFNGAFESTRATCIADVDEVEKNTCDINGTLDGAKNVDFYFVQNFRCQP